MGRNIGIFSGTFDPVHKGHVAFALAALEQAGLDKVVFLPEQSPRAKTGVGEYSHRLEMVRRATESYTQLGVLSMDTPKFTVRETLPQLSARYIGDHITLLFGSDVVRTFGARWPGLARLAEQVDFIIGLRGNESRAGLQEFLDTLHVPIRAKFVQVSHAHQSATQIRGGDLQGVEPAVRDYIQANQLYGQAT